MRKTLILTATLGFGAIVLTPTPSMAQTMNLQEFVTVANRIPQNPTALLRSDFRRIRREFEGGMRALSREEASAKAAGRPTSACPPSEITISATDTLRRLNAIPEARRRSMTITDGVRQIMRDRFPCPA